MKIFYVVFFLWCTCLMLFLLPSAVMGSNSALPCTSAWQFNELLTTANSISDSDRFAHTITIDVKATDNETCHPSKQEKSSATCKSLNDALQMYHGISSVMFYLIAPDEVYYLNFTYKVTNQHTIWFRGNSTWPQAMIPTVRCMENVGLSFINSSNISFSNVKFLNCGSDVQISTTSTNSSTESRIKAGLYFYNCTNVKMHQIQVLNSPQASGVLMYDTDGRVEVCNSTFSNNSVLNLEDHTYAGGGGFAVEFNYYKPGDSDTYDRYYRKNKNSTYSFHNCTFCENVAINSAINHAYIIKRNYYLDTAGQGGGLKLNFQGNAKNNAFHLTNCHFFKNTATWGGGLHIQIDNHSSNNSIKASNCYFLHNSALLELNDTYTAGGAINIITTTQNFNRIHIKDCNFTHNNATKGGGICFYIARQANTDNLLDILIKNSIFESNSARIGSAVCIVAFPIFASGVLPPITIHDSTFLDNHYLYLNPKLNPVHLVGIAAVYVSDIPLSFQNHTIFNSNLGSALTAVGTQLNFTNSFAYFSNNSGDDGGAIALLGAAFILIGPNTSMTFVGNTASRYGGAIYNRYISVERLLSTADCFLRYTEPLVEPDSWKAQFNFSGNRALIGGCSIFTSSIVPCTWTDGNNSNAFHWKNWKFYDSKCNHSSEVQTEPTNFSSSISSLSISDPIKIFPGEIFKIPLSAFDDLGNDITANTIYSAQMQDDKSKSVAQVADGFTYIIANYMSITGKPKSNITLQLQTEGSRTKHVLLNVTIQDCPPGFVCKYSDHNNSDRVHGNSLPLHYIQQIECRCPAEKYMYQNNLRCNQEKFTSRININYWYGPVTVHFGHSNKTLLLMGSIPLVYRTQNIVAESDTSTIELPRYIDKIDERLCGGVHRWGVLCGECIKGYAVAVNSRSYECVPCDKNSTTPGEFIKFLSAYIALTYFPIMIFFILIIFFDIKLASSAAVSFVLYSQIISTGSFLYPQTPHGAAQTIRTILMTVYGIFNLESFAFLMPPFCLNESFTTLHVLCLDYAVALFPLVIIVIIYLPYKCKLVCCNCHCRANQGTADSETVIDADPNSTTSARSISASQRPCCNKPPKSTLIHAFTAFIILSYTKFGLASMKTVFITELFDAQSVSKIQRIYLAGHLGFSDSQFLFPFGVLALLVLVFIVFLPPLLLLGPLQFVDWLADKPRFRCIHKFWPSITIHTLLDTFQGYKPRRRFFAGLHLLLRLALFLVISFSPGLLSQYVLQLIIILIFFALVSLLRPYTKDYYNSLEILLLLNLGVLNSITIYVSNLNYTAGIFTLECILILSPLVYIICFVIWNKAHKKKHYKKVKERIGRHLVNPVKSSSREETEKLFKSNRGDGPFGESINYCSSDDPDEEIFQRAARGNRYRTANIQTHPPSRPGGVYKSVVSILEPQIPKNESQREVREGPSTTNRSDFGIGRQSDGGKSVGSFSDT